MPILPYGLLAARGLPRQNPYGPMAWPQPQEPDPYGAPPPMPQPGGPWGGGFGGFAQPPAPGPQPQGFPAMPAMPGLPGMQSPFGQVPAPRPRATGPEPLTEEERSGVWSTAIAGLAGAGNLFDLPGSSLRDVLAGQNPFDQWLSPFTGENRTSGRELLRHHGLIGEEDTFGNWLGGVATEIAADPLWLVTGPLGTLARGAKVGAKATKAADVAADVARAGKTLTATEKVGTMAKAVQEAGETAWKAGSRPTEFLPLTPAAIADQIRQGERGILGIRIPFTQTQLASVGAGSETAARLAETLAYADRGIMRAVSAPIRAIRSLFSPATKGRLHGPGQMAADMARSIGEVLEGGLDNLVPEVRIARDGLLDEYGAIAKHLGVEGDEAGMREFMTRMVEEKELPDLGTYLDRFREHLNYAGDLPPAAIQWSEASRQFLESLKGTQDTAWQRVGDLGARVRDFKDVFISRGLSRRGAHADLMTPAAARKHHLTNVPGGTVTLQNISLDDRIVGFRHLSTADKKTVMKDLRDWAKVNSSQWGAEKGVKGLNQKELRRTYLWQEHVEPELRQFFEHRGGLNVLDDGTEQTYEQAVKYWLEPLESKVRRAGKVEEITRAAPIDRLEAYFANAPREMLGEGLFPYSESRHWYEYQKGILGLEANLRGLHHMLKSPGNIRSLAEAGTVPLKKAWNEAGLTDRGLQTFLEESGRTLDDLGTTGVSEATARSIKATMEFSKPETLSEVVKLYDRVHALYRGGLTTAGPFLGFHVRNLGSGITQEVTEGKINVAQVMLGKWAAVRAATRGVKRGIESPMQFLDEIFDHRERLFGHGKAFDIASEAARGMGDIPESLAASLGKPLKRAFTGGRQAWSPLGVRGVRKHMTDMAPGETEVLNWMAELGENAYKLVEFVNRGGYYEGLRRAGYTPAQALHYVTRAHFDYSDLSRFEKSVARRMFLFYGWKRHSVPYTLLKLAERPGGPTAQLIRTLTARQREEQARPGGGAYIPSFLRERVSQPIGQQGPETTFMTQAGLPVEDLNAIVLRRDLATSLRRTAERNLAETNPLLSTVAEQFAGRQFFTGRPLETLEPRTGNRALDVLLARGPWSRYIGEAERVADMPRKGMVAGLANVTTGLKFSTYDTEKWRLIDALDRSTEELRADPMVGQGSYQYIKGKYKEQAPAELRGRLQRRREIQEMLQQYLDAQRSAP